MLDFDKEANIKTEAPVVRGAIIEGRNPNFHHHTVRI
jgi:hypothetical protein